MENTKKKRKFKREVEQDQPTNPKADNTKSNTFDIDSDTIKDKKNKK
jgi:hypothetical protein